MHILISPNAFKNSLTAYETAKAIEKGLNSGKLKCTSEIFPVGDGGDGTAQVMTRLCNGEYFDAKVSGPLGRQLVVAAGLIDKGETAVIDLASASGLKLLSPSEYDPMKASTYGTGELIKAALDKKVKKILIGVGGSATVDGGCGIAEALGVRFLDKGGEKIAPLPSNLLQVSSIDVSGLDKRIAQCDITVLCDVTNPLLGPNGAPAVFGPQKGATSNMVKMLDEGLAHLSRVAGISTGRFMSSMVHGGAAGGAAAGLAAFLNAKLVNGIDHFLDVTHFDVALERSDLVITGEGSIDEQTLAGKAPYGVAVRAKKRNIPVIAFAGMVPLADSNALHQYFDVLLAIGHQPTGLSDALKNTENNLIRTATELSNILAIAK